MALKEQDVMSEVDYLSVETLQLWSDVALKTNSVTGMSL